MIKRFLLVAMTLSSVSCFANHAQESLSGTYHCSGHEVGTNVPYTCQMTIKKTDKTYHETAICDDDTSYNGTGIYDSQRHSLATVFVNPQNSAETGVAVSQVKSDGSMVTVWTYLDHTSVAQSTCHKLR